MIFPYLWDAEDIARNFLPIIIGMINTFISAIVGIITQPLFIIPALLLTILTIFRLFIKDKEI